MSTYCIATSWDNVIAKHFRALAGALADRSHRVFLLIDRRRYDVVDERNNPVILTWPSRRPTRLRDAWWFARLAHKHHPDAIIANFGATNIVLCVAAALGVPVRVAWYHTLTRQIQIDGGFDSAVARLKLWRKRLVYRTATHFATASEAARSDLAAAYMVRPGMISCQGYSLADPMMDDITSKQYDVVCVGRLHRSKGQDVLLRALPQLPSTTTLCLVGDGPARGEYLKLAEELGILPRCKFLGAVPVAEVPAYMANSKVTVVPSRDEAFGIVNIESMAVGTPVVASAVGGIPEILRNGTDGFLVPPNDHRALARAIRRLLESPDLRRSMSASARQRFLHHYEQSAVVARQADWLESIVQDAV